MLSKDEDSRYRESPPQSKHPYSIIYACGTTTLNMTTKKAEGARYAHPLLG
jgi:hypothetical protein